MHSTINKNGRRTIARGLDLQAKLPQAAISPTLQMEKLQDVVLLVPKTPENVSIAQNYNLWLTHDTSYILPRTTILLDMTIVPMVVQFRLAFEYFLFTSSVMLKVRSTSLGAPHKVGRDAAQQN
jgi:hypothetical protein